MKLDSSRSPDRNATLHHTGGWNHWYKSTIRIQGGGGKRDCQDKMRKTDRILKKGKRKTLVGEGTSRSLGYNTGVNEGCGGNRKART